MSDSPRSRIIQDCLDASEDPLRQIFHLIENAVDLFGAGERAALEKGWTEAGVEPAGDLEAELSRRVWEFRRDLRAAVLVPFVSGEAGSPELDAGYVPPAKRWPGGIPGAS